MECPHPLTTVSHPSMLEASPQSTRAQIHLEVNREPTQVNREATQVVNSEASLTMEVDCEPSCRVSSSP